MARLEIVAEIQTRRIVEHDPEYRTQLRLTLEGEPPVARTCRCAWADGSNG
jgi:hypothetical protein